MDGLKPKLNLFFLVSNPQRMMDRGKCWLGFVKEETNLELWQGESELMNAELPAVHINITESLSQNSESYNSLLSLLPSALLRWPGVSKSSLKPEWKRGSYRFKHFPLGFISFLTRRSLPGLIGLPGNLLLHRWLGRMTAQCGTKCVHWICQITVRWRARHCLMSSRLNTAQLQYHGGWGFTQINQKIFKKKNRTKSPPCHFVLDWVSLQ